MGKFSSRDHYNIKLIVQERQGTCECTHRYARIWTLHKVRHSYHTVALVTSSLPLLSYKHTYIHLVLCWDVDAHHGRATTSALPLCQSVSVSQWLGCGDKRPHTPLAKKKKKLQSIKRILGKSLFLPRRVTVQTLRANWLSTQMWCVFGETERDKERGREQKRVISCLNRLCW